MKLLQECHEGRLEGGLSVALDVRPDELLGPLLQRMGGQATQLRVFDVRGQTPSEWTVHFDGTEEVWEIENLSHLVHRLNDFFRLQPSVRAIVELGEWQDMLQLWCVKKTALRRMLKDASFRPQNGHDLQQWFA